MKAAAWASVGIAGVALALSIASVLLAFRSESRLDRQEEQQIAAQISLAEAPMFAYEARPSSCITCVYWVVMNYSSSQVENVWVEGQEGRSVRISGQQPCSLYALPEGFEPIAVHFEDIYASWRRAKNGVPEKAGELPPNPDTDDSTLFLDLPNCP